MSDTLKSGAVQLGIALDDEAAGKLLRLLDELDVWNERVNLTAIRERAQQITKHLLDSLSVYAHLHGTRIADIGTGAGFPGLPLAIVAPHLHFTLVDSTAKKLKFIDHVAALLPHRESCRDGANRGRRCEARQSHGDIRTGE